MKYQPEQVVLMKKDEERTDGDRYTDQALRLLKENNYILTIESISKHAMLMYQTDTMPWRDHHVKEILMTEDGQYVDRIDSRFEILDL